MPSLLAIKNLSISFANHQVLDNFSLQLKSKKITALVGPSGSGKSVIALAILNLLRGAKISGEIIFEEKNLLAMSEKNLCKIRGQEIGFIFQDPNTSLNPLHKIGKQISEAITIHNPKISKKDLQYRIEELLKMVELEAMKSRLNDYPHQLSGGQKQRLMIAIAIANNPKILIADEPTTALDVVVQLEILKLLKRLRDELGIAILLITHNLNVVKKIADEVINISSSLSCVAIRGSQESEHKFMSDESADGEILSIKNLSVFYKNSQANRDINFSLRAGENLGVIGESGSGKSTLAVALLSLIPSQGEIKFFGEKTWKKNQSELRREVQIIFQDPFSSLDPRMSVSDIIEEGLIVHKASFEKGGGFAGKCEVGGFTRGLVVDEILNKMHLDLNLKNRYPHQLSGGQRQRVAIARALILNPKILILDEPTSALDFTTQNEILNLLIEIQKERQISYILISHDLEVVARIADKIAVLKDGAILELDEKAKLISNPRHSYTKQLISNL